MKVTGQYKITYFISFDRSFYCIRT